MIERTGSKDEARSAVAAARKEGKTIGFVPTMGALHEGHLSLVRAACRRCDFVAVSIFVNPTQFGPGEDFERYPRCIDDDLSLLSAEGADLVFTPSREAMYRDDARVTVDPGPLACVLEGAIRPGHFVGVATIVTKMLSLMRADLAFFGEKDYQQLKVIELLARDLDLGTGIIGCPTVRDHGGLALSSRNAYLSAEERTRAHAIPAALEAAAQVAAWGPCATDEIVKTMRETLDEAGLVTDYAVVVDPATLQPIDRLDGVARALIAARVGDVRLIDNCALQAAD